MIGFYVLCKEKSAFFETNKIMLRKSGEKKNRGFMRNLPTGQVNKLLFGGVWNRIKTKIKSKIHFWSAKFLKNNNNK